MNRAPLLALVIAAVVWALPARAQDRKTEAVARDALQGAQADYATGAYEKGITRLRRATRACGTTKCSSATRALLLRDTGAIEFHSGDEEGGAEAFVEALKIEPNAELSQRYDTPEVRAAWNAAKDEVLVANAGQPAGDFVHTPAAEQAVRTPLPIYAEVDASVSKVIVRYKGASMKDYGRFDLARVGKGWGGLIPCGDVTRGVMRYYLVGVDSSGTPAATSGDPKRPFFVRIRPQIASAAPSLPGSAPPKQCTLTEAPPRPPPPPVGTTPEKEPEKEPEPEPTTPGKKKEFARFWFGVAGALDIGLLPSGTNVCRLTADGQPQNSSGYFCTDPNGGTDFPANKKQNDALIAGKAGSPNGGFGAGDARVLISFDYAVSASFLVGGRIGYVANGYPGSAASSAGKAFGPSLHFEARATYLFGAEPLTRVGFAPMVTGGTGIAEFDSGTVVQTAQTGVAGQQATVAWHTGGPFFIAVGGGARYAFSPSIAFWSLAKLQAAIGGSGLLPSLAPEIGIQYGF